MIRLCWLFLNISFWYGQTERTINKKKVIYFIRGGKRDKEAENWYLTQLITFVRAQLKVIRNRKPIDLSRFKFIQPTNNISNQP